VLIPSPEILNEICNLLVFRKDCRGRCLSNKYPKAALHKYDRLIPTKELLDVSKFEDVELPCLAKFWRMSKTDRLCHDCPLFDVPGVTVDSWVIDLLHSWALGPLAVFIAWVIMFIVKTGVFHPTSDCIDSKMKDELAMQCVKALLKVHYKKKHAENPQWQRSCTEEPTIDISFICCDGSLVLIMLFFVLLFRCQLDFQPRCGT